MGGTDSTGSAFGTDSEIGVVGGTSVARGPQVDTILIVFAPLDVVHVGAKLNGTWVGTVGNVSS